MNMPARLLSGAGAAPGQRVRRAGAQVRASWRRCARAAVPWEQREPELFARPRPNARRTAPIEAAAAAAAARSDRGVRGPRLDRLAGRLRGQLARDAQRAARGGGAVRRFAQAGAPRPRSLHGAFGVELFAPACAGRRLAKPCAVSIGSIASVLEGESGGARSLRGACADAAPERRRARSAARWSRRASTSSRPIGRVERDGYTLEPLGARLAAAAARCWHERSTSARAAAWSLCLSRGGARAGAGRGRVDSADRHRGAGGRGSRSADARRHRGQRRSGAVRACRRRHHPRR